MLNDVLSVIFPSFCLGCNRALSKGEPDICTRCVMELPINRSLLNHTAHDRILSGDAGGELFFLLEFEKKGTVQKLLHAIKYKGGRKLARDFGRQFGLSLKKRLPSDTCVVPVPLHPKRQRERGFNQSTEIALGICESSGLLLQEKLLKRIQMTTTQTKKSKNERIENMKGVFAPGEISLPKSPVLLVDDVTTTGSTLESCAEVLLEAGFTEIRGAVLAIAR